jgi:hypothetical protein
MRACKTAVRVVLILGFLVLGAFAGSHVYGAWTHPNHECKLDAHCIGVYSPNHPACNANFPDCIGGGTDQFWKCLPKNNVGCSESVIQFGATICAGFCCVWDPILQLWILGAPIVPCNYQLDHCK